MIEDREPFVLHLGVDGWQRIEDRQAALAPFGLWSVRIAQHELQSAAQLNFTRRYKRGWEQRDHLIELAAPAQS